MEIMADLIRAAGSGGNTHQTLVTHLATMMREERITFGNPTSVKRTSNRHIASGRPDDLRALNNLTIQGSWADDHDGNPFLLHDNNNNNRIIIFASERCIRYLSSSKDVNFCPVHAVDLN